MKIPHILIIFLLLMMPFSASAGTEGGKLKIISPIDSVKTPVNISTVNNTSVNNSLNYTDDMGTGYTDSINPVSESSTATKQDSNLNIAEQVVVGGVCKTIVSLVNMLISGLGGVHTGELNNSSESGEKVLIFAVVAHTIDPTTDPGTEQDVKNCRDNYVYFIVLFALVLAIFLLFQQLNPMRAAQLVEVVTGQYGFVAINDMFEYYTVTCGWLLLGPAEFYSALWLNNYLVISSTLSVLDSVAFSTENVTMYLILGLLWAVLAAFFALRLVSILLIVRVWYLFGLLLSTRYTRWIGLLIVAYMNGVIFAQYLLVWPVVAVITYINTHALTGISENFVYLGLFLFEIGITAIVVLWPALVALLSPKTWRAVLTVSRYTL